MRVDMEEGGQGMRDGGRRAGMRVVMEEGGQG